METRTDRAENVASIQLARGEEIKRGGEEADPCGPADGVQQESGWRRARMKQAGEKTQQERSAEDDVDVRGVRYTGDDPSMEDAIDERGDGEDKTDKRAGGADIKKGTVRTNGRAHKDKSAKSADERREGNEKRIAGANVVVAASEKVTELMGEKNGEQSDSEREAREQSGGIFVEESEGAEELVDGYGLVVGVGDGKLGAGDEAGAKREEEECHGEEESLAWRVGKSRGVKRIAGKRNAPSSGKRISLK